VTVRVCYLSRTSLGSSIRSLRLVGHASDEAWPTGQGVVDADHAAQWVRSRLANLRSTNSLALLCLDVEGGVCSWLSAPSGSPAMVAAIARGGSLAADDAPARAGSSPIEFYAGDPYASSIQPLDHVNGATKAETRRMPVLAISDVPGRLLMDALDRVNISVEAAATLWHVMAHTWDPGSPRAGTPATGDHEAPTDAPVSGVVMVDPENARLLWTWSQAGRLLVAGSMRLRRAAVETNAITESDSDAAAPMTIAYGAEDVSRLTVEWLSWAAQVGQVPTRIVCITPDQAQAGPFGRALGQAWNGATVDVVVRPDPIGDTLARAASIIENTPKAADDDPQLALVELSSRPGRSHRRLFMWWSAAVAVGAVALGLFGWQLQQNAAEAREAALTWRDQQGEAIAEVMPGAKTGVGPEGSLYNQLRNEVTRLEKAASGPRRNDNPLPVLQELETLSLVIGNSGLALDTQGQGIEIDSRGARIRVLTNTTSEAEALFEAFKRVSGSNLVDWTFNPQSRTEGEAVRVRGEYTARWDPRLKPQEAPR